MRKRLFTAIFALICLSSLAVLGSTTEFVDRILESVRESLSGDAGKTKESKDFNVELAREEPEVASIQPTPDAVNARHIEIPDDVLWRVILGFPAKFNILAENARAAGQDETLYTGYFTRQAHLSVENAEIFKQKALEYSAELGPVKERMQEIGRYTKTAREKSQKLPKEESYSLRQELVALQKRQKEIVLKYRDEFRNAIDPESFAGFERWLKTDFAANFSAKSITSGDAKATPKSNVQSNGFDFIERAQQEENQK